MLAWPLTARSNAKKKIQMPISTDEDKPQSLES